MIDFFEGIVGKLTEKIFELVQYGTELPFLSKRCAMQVLLTRGHTMKSIYIFGLFMLMLSSSSVWAYGSSSATKACDKPRFSEFTPINNAQVAAETEFSFLASSNTHSKSISVTVKNQPVEVDVVNDNNALRVSGKLPAALSNTAARINITAEAGNGCKGSDGWLLIVK